MKKISAVIPAYNEEEQIASIIYKTKRFIDEVLVINDCSDDKTAELAANAGARVISNDKNIGYIECIKKGFRNVQGDIIITLDADGEHMPEEIPNLLKPILEDEADLVLGNRRRIPRVSERFLNWLTNSKIKIKDSGTGFRAIKKKLSLKLNLKGSCTCGIFVLEAASHGAKIVEVPITIRYINKRRKIAWRHLFQLFYVLSWLKFRHRKF